MYRQTTICINMNEMKFSRNSFIVVAGGGTVIGKPFLYRSMHPRSLF